MDTDRETRSFLMPRDPSVDRRCRPRPAKRERLFSDIGENDCYEESDSDSVEDDSDDVPLTDEGLTENKIDSSTSLESGALVYLRLKPVEVHSSAYSIAEDGKVFITAPTAESTSSSRNKNVMMKRYSFSAIFDSVVSQREIYEKCIGEKILTEESLTVLTYGTSGSGKTFTLLGDDIQPGIIPRALENIFTLYESNIHPNPLAKLVNARTTFLDDNLVEKETLLRRQVLDNCKCLEPNYLQLQRSIRSDHHFGTMHDDDVSVFIWVTFVEIYNELVYDLLDPIKSGSSFIPANVSRKSLKIVCNDGNIFIKGVTSIYVKNSLEALKLLRSGLQKLTYASTSINANSSRSHCVFFVDVLKYFRNGVYTETSYKFCDLAGSERLDKSGNMGSRLKEAQRINTSLMVLGRCLDAASNFTTNGFTTLSLNRKERIPFRESKLTMILQAALQGKEKLTMIVNVTPTEKYYEENLNVLNFASIASNIIFQAPAIKQNQTRYSLFGTAPDNSYIQQLMEENANLKADVKKLNEHNARKDQQIEDGIDEIYHLKEEIETLTQQHAQELLRQEQELRNELVDAFKIRLDEHKKQSEMRIERELENQKRSYEYKIDVIKRRHEEEMEDLREDLENGEEKNYTVENLIAENIHIQNKIVNDISVRATDEQDNVKGNIDEK